VPSGTQCNSPDVPRGCHHPIWKHIAYLTARVGLYTTRLVRNMMCPWHIPDRLYFDGMIVTNFSFSGFLKVSFRRAFEAAIATQLEKGCTSLTKRLLNY
jgi:hypothetical protein